MTAPLTDWLLRPGETRMLGVTLANPVTSPIRVLSIGLPSMNRDTCKGARFLQVLPGSARRTS